jgi:hypothetical protein
MRVAALSWHLRWQARMRGARVRSDLRLRRLLRGGDRIIIGPFLSEVGFELLYWIPMLNRAWEEHGVDPGRVTAISRGGARDWYHHLADEYVDVLDFFPVDELREWQQRRIASAGSQKQHLGASDLDREVLRRAAGSLSAGGARTLHPSLMYRRFWDYFMGRTGISTVLDRIAFRRLSAPRFDPETLIPGLTAPYVAVKAYTSETLPGSDENRASLAGLIGRLADSMAVVDLSSDLNLDEHRGFGVESRGNVFRLAGIGPEENLAAQTAVVAGASALISTYGGFAYLGPFLGVPSYAMYSERAFNIAHQEMMSRAAAQLDAGFTPLPIAELERVTAGVAIFGTPERSREATAR